MRVSLSSWTNTPFGVFFLSCRALKSVAELTDRSKKQRAGKPPRRMTPPSRAHERKQRRLACELNRHVHLRSSVSNPARCTTSGCIGSTLNRAVAFVAKDLRAYMICVCVCLCVCVCVCVCFQCRIARGRRVGSSFLRSFPFAAVAALSPRLLSVANRHKCAACHLLFFVQPSATLITFTMPGMNATDIMATCLSFQSVNKKIFSRLHTVVATNANVQVGKCRFFLKNK